MKIEILSLAILASVLMFSCKHEPLLTPIPIIENPVITETCDTNLVYFEEQILPIFQGCATTDCHDPMTAEDGVILNNYNNIINTGDVDPGDPENSEVYEMITETDPDDRMPPPPASPLSQESIDLIYNWIAQGAENNSCPDLICDTLDVTFSADIQPMVNSFCAGCHTGIAPYGGIQLTTYDQISEAAGASPFLDMIDGNVELTMPENTSGLTDCQVRMFEIWIEDGRPNN